MKKQTFTPEESGYANETLMNGNITHCAEYIGQLFNEGYFKTAVEELNEIKLNSPDRYDFILNKAYLYTFKAKQL